MLSLEVLITAAADDIFIFYVFFYVFFLCFFFFYYYFILFYLRFLKCQVLFSLKNNKIKVECLLLQFCLALYRLTMSFVDHRYVGSIEQE